MTPAQMMWYNIVQSHRAGGCTENDCEIVKEYEMISS